jgi:hypothetical protein
MERLSYRRDLSQDEPALGQVLQRGRGEEV